MTIPTIPGITARTMTTDRITTRVLFSGPAGGTPVLFLHGNLSSATWWEEVMITLPAGYRGIAPDQRGFGAADAAKKVDGTRGMGDLADDAVALFDHLEIEQAHLVGNSLGSVVAWRIIAENSGRLLTVTQAAPGSPYGFGCTKDVDGTPCTDDFAGSGGGLVNAEVVKNIAAGDRSTDSPFTVRSALRALVFKPPFVPEREEELLSASLSIHLGEQDYPGDSTPSPNWPFVAPGRWGVNNALSPKYINNVSGMLAAENKPPVLWIRGSDDLTVSDTAAADMGALGAAGIIPGWPGMEAYPPQPMLSQIRTVLEKYTAAGGAFKEVVIDGAAHDVYLEHLELFNEHFHKHIS